jgi:hypothetical protein
LVDEPERVSILHAFLNFGFSAEGQEILKEKGFWPLNEWEKLAQHTKMQCKHGMDMTSIQQYCGQEGASLTMAGSAMVLPVANIWTQMFKLGCPIDATIEGGGTNKGAHRVCGDFEYGTRVDVVRKLSSIFVSIRPVYNFLLFNFNSWFSLQGMMSADFDPSEAVLRDNGFVYDCLVGDKTRSVIKVDVAVDGVTIVFPIGGSGHECVSKYMEVSLEDYILLCSI